MRPFLTKALIAITFSTSFLACASQPPADQEAQFLNTDARPESMKAKIQTAFEGVSTDPSNKWTYNGEELYKIGGLNEHRLILNMISENPDQEDFYVLDVGCGVFEWGKALQSFLNQMVDEKRRERITVHIVGMNGGIDTGVNGQQDKVGCCKLYGIPTFPIENIKKWKHGALWPFLDKQEVKFDLVVSRSTFQHLVDPIGTLVDTYNFVRPGGYLIADILRWHLSCIAHYFEVSLFGLCDGCKDHGLSLVAVGGSTELKIPAAYSAEDDRTKYTWLVDKKTEFDCMYSVGFGRSSRHLAEYLLSSGVIDERRNIDAKSAREAINLRKSVGLYSGEVPESDEEAISLAKQVLVKEKYLSHVKGE